jgi:hypothetical protein
MTAVRDEDGLPWAQRNAIPALLNPHPAPVTAHSVVLARLLHSGLCGIGARAGRFSVDFPGAAFLAAFCFVGEACFS